MANSIFDRFSLTCTQGSGSRYILSDEFGISVELGLSPVHGNIPETRFTRRIEWGFGWYNKNSCIAAHFQRRFWFHPYVTWHECKERRLFASVYWRQFDGLHIRFYGRNIYA